MVGRERGKEKGRDENYVMTKFIIALHAIILWRNGQAWV